MFICTCVCVSLPIQLISYWTIFPGTVLSSKWQKQWKPAGEVRIRRRFDEVNFKECLRTWDVLECSSGQEVCVSCESKANRPHLGNRCSGHGVDNKLTRFTMTTLVIFVIFAILVIFAIFVIFVIFAILDIFARFKNVISPACHGRWTRVDAWESCPCKEGPQFIFVWDKVAAQKIIYKQRSMVSFIRLPLHFASVLNSCEFFV